MDPVQIRVAIPAADPPGNLHVSSLRRVIVRAWTRVAFTTGT
jgi:hypothetical protein